MLQLTLGHQWGSLVPAVPARAPRASSPPPCASAPHSAGVAPAPAAFAAPSPAFVAVGQEADNPEETGHNEGGGVLGNQQGKLQNFGCELLMRDADMPEGSLSPVLLGETLARTGGQQLSVMQNTLLFAMQVDCPRLLRCSH